MAKPLFVEKSNAWAKDLVSDVVLALETTSHPVAHPVARLVVDPLGTRVAAKPDKAFAIERHCSRFMKKR